MLKTALSIALVMVTAFGCYAPAMEQESVAVAALKADGEPCVDDAECAPTAKLCGVAACLNGECGAVLLPAGAPCSTGVGICNAVGVCGKVDGLCKGWDQWTEASVTPCVNDSECDDSNACTEDKCAIGYCVHVPLSDGAQCLYAGLLCKQGLCCVED